MSNRKMTEEEKKNHLDSISFSNLVRAIDEKWSHTYIDPSITLEDPDYFDISDSQTKH